MRSFGNYTDGVIKFRADGTTFYSGFPSTQWVFPVLSDTQYGELQSVYCGGAGGYSGLVTIKTNTHSRSTYANFNATLILPQPSEMGFSQSRRYARDVAIRFIQMAAL